MGKKLAKNSFRVILFASTAISLFFVPWILVKAWILPLPENVQTQVEQSLSHGFDGMIVYVDQKGKEPEFYTAGWHDRDLEIPAKSDALFKIASISKLYTAVSISKLVDSNQLSLDETLSDYFPELIGKIEYSEKITLRMMVQHTSGIPNFTNNSNYWTDTEDQRKTELEYAFALPTSFEPDQDYEYSNTNYFLLREIIKKVTGNHHFQFIQDEILKPLSLTNNYQSLDGLDLNRVMSGYYVGVKEDLKTTEYGMLATAQDVGIFLRALNDGSIFNGNEAEIYSGLYEYEHGGLVPGYQSLTKYEKDIDTVIVQFMNTTDFNGYEWNLSQISMNRMAKILRKNEVSE